MKANVFFVAVFVALTSISISPGNGAPSPKPDTSAHSLEGNTNNGNGTGDVACQNGLINGTEKCGVPASPKTLMGMVRDNKDMVMRTFYVLLGVTAVVILYFVVRTVRSRGRKNRAKKYGVISTSASELEMTPLEQDNDDDEDMTVFDVNGIK